MLKLKVSKLSFQLPFYFIQQGANQAEVLYFCHVELRINTRASQFHAKKHLVAWGSGPRCL